MQLTTNGRILQFPPSTMGRMVYMIVKFDVRINCVCFLRGSVANHIHKQTSRWVAALRIYSSRAWLFAQSETADDFFVTGWLFFTKISQVAASLANHFEQTTTRMVILLVPFEMFHQLVDALGQEGNLHLR